ncbi:MAG: hypothetical protein EA397_16950 [Deltaproteobacteria bacterium]|nr:MAG: hypothetical protein EA397_16950 [Deltaproteobacteria bacterium]
MNHRFILPLLALASCAPGRVLLLISEADLQLTLDADSVDGEVVVLIDGLSAEILEDYIGEPSRDLAGSQRGGLRVEIVLTELASGRVDVALLDESMEVHQWSSNGLLSSGRSDRFTSSTNRDEAPWSDRFLVVRYLEEGDCIADEPCEIRLPIGLDRRRGDARELHAQVRFGAYGSRLDERPIDREVERGVGILVDWEPLE